MNKSNKTKSFSPFSYNETALSEIDPVAGMLIDQEEARQQCKLILIASESMAPKAVRQALASGFTNIYAEGYPALRMTEAAWERFADTDFQTAYQRRYGDRRYYKGCDYVNFVETLAKMRVRRLFANERVPYEQVRANVQPLSGAAANNAVYNAFLDPGDLVMGLDLTHGGHLTHGHEMNRSGINYRIIHYQVNRASGTLDYDRIIETAKAQRPRLIIAGYSAYPWSVDWARLREAADAAGGAILLADIAHTAGLVAAGVYPNPIGYADVVTFTTHKTMCGPRGAVILTTERINAEHIDRAVFPGEQGGPHVNNIAAKAVIFGIAATKEFRALQKSVVQNAAHLARSLEKEGLTLAYGGTDTHMVLVDLKSIRGEDGSNLTGEIASRVLDLCGITCNKNTIAGDENAAHPSAIRLGTTWVTQLGMGKPEMERIAAMIAKLIKSIRPFAYTDIQGEIGRGKTDLHLLKEVRAEVDGLLGCDSRTLCGPGPLPQPALASLYGKSGSAIEGEPESVSAIGDSTCLIDLTDHEAFWVHGDPDRASAFLSQLTTVAATEMDPGRGARGFVLGRNGDVLAPICLMRFSDDEQGLARYLAIAGPASPFSVSEWFDAVSDGYTVFDDEDLVSKVEGPVVLRRDDRQTVALLGKDPSALMKDAVRGAALPESGGFVETGEDEGGRAVFRATLEDGRDWVEILGQTESLPGLWETLRGGGALPCGKTLRDQVMESVGLGCRPSTPLRDLVSGPAGKRIALQKLYFVGQRTVADLIPSPGKRERFTWKEPEGASPKRTVLYENHLRIARKNYIVPFAGWEMPVRYGSIIEEHLAVRQAAGLFDVGHMGTIGVHGRGATRFLDVLATNYVPWLQPGQSHYSYILDCDGNVLDDVMIYRHGPEQYLMVVNAANFEKVFAYLTAALEGRILLDAQIPARSVPESVTVEDLRDPAAGERMRVDIALQGPASLEILAAMTDDARMIRTLRQLRRNEFMDAELLGEPAMISVTGYTGAEEGFELYVHPDHAPELWDALLERGEPFGLKPCGLGARDSLRTEAGLPLYGHELAGRYAIGPGGAGYSSFVKLHKPFFVGKAAYLDQEKSRDMTVVRFEIAGKGMRPVKGHDVIADRKGAMVGYVTSCASLEEGQVGLAWVRKSYSKPELRLSIFPAPTEGEPLAAGTQIGSRLPLPVEATIVSRFPEP